MRRNAPRLSEDEMALLLQINYARLESVQQSYLNAFFAKRQAATIAPAELQGAEKVVKNHAMILHVTQALIYF
jgi:hypothetical protein